MKKIAFFIFLLGGLINSQITWASSNSFLTEIDSTKKAQIYIVDTVYKTVYVVDTTISNKYVENVFYYYGSRGRYYYYGLIPYYSNYWYGNGWVWYRYSSWHSFPYRGYCHNDGNYRWQEKKHDDFYESNRDNSYYGPRKNPTHNIPPTQTKRASARPPGSRENNYKNTPEVKKTNQTMQRESRSNPKASGYVSPKNPNQKQAVGRTRATKINVSPQNKMVSPAKRQSSGNKSTSLPRVSSINSKQAGGSRINSSQQRKSPSSNSTKSTRPATRNNGGYRR